MKLDPTIDREVVVPIIDRIRELGGDVESLLADCGLVRSWSDAVVSTLPEAKVWKLFYLAAQRMNLPEIGLQTGAHFRVRDLGQFGRRLEQSLTLFHCLSEYINTVKRYSSHAKFWLKHEAGGVWFCRRGIDRIADGRDYVEQFALQLMIQLVRLAAGPDWIPNNVRLQAKALGPYRDVNTFDSTEFDRKRAVTAVWIPTAEMLKMVRRRNDDVLTQQVRDTVSSTDQFQPNLAATARRLGYSRRTLQRELAMNGLDWSRLLDQVRLERAAESLKSRDVRLGELACELGYTDRANFGRAFRRWTGVTPRAYRLHLVGNADE